MPLTPPSDSCLTAQSPHSVGMAWNASPSTLETSKINTHSGRFLAPTSTAVARLALSSYEEHDLRGWVDKVESKREEPSVAAAGPSQVEGASDDAELKQVGSWLGPDVEAIKSLGSRLGSIPTPRSFVGTNPGSSAKKNWWELWSQHGSEKYGDLSKLSRRGD